MYTGNTSSEEEWLHETCLTIVNSGMGCDALVLLSKMLSGRKIRTDRKLMFASNSLSAIKKINAGKNEAIDALCEQED